MANRSTVARWKTKRKYSSPNPFIFPIVSFASPLLALLEQTGLLYCHSSGYNERGRGKVALASFLTAVWLIRDRFSRLWPSIVAWIPCSSFTFLFPSYIKKALLKDHKCSGFFLITEYRFFSLEFQTTFTGPINC